MSMASAQVSFKVFKIGTIVASKTGKQGYPRVPSQLKRGLASGGKEIATLPHIAMEALDFTLVT